MATTSRPISELVSGIRDTAGAVVASGKVRFYQPGTLVVQTVFSDPACASAIAQPYILTAVGQGTVYTLEAVRMVAKDSTETTTYYDDIVNLNRHDAVYVTHPNWNSGAETTLEGILTLLATNLGTNGGFQESAGAVVRSFTEWLGELCVSVKDFGAVGNGTTDDTVAIQAAFDRVEARGGGWVYFPKGTYRISAAINIDTAGVSAFGAGRGIAVIKNFGTTTNAITVNITGDSKIVFRDFSITANTTSSGAGISFTSGNFATVQNVGVALHRTGYDFANVTGATLRTIYVDSTDDNAASVGVSLGTRCRLIAGSEISSGTTNGTGILGSGLNSRCLESFVSRFATGITLSGANAQANAMHVSLSTTGIVISGTDADARNCDCGLNTTGVSLTGTRAIAMGCSVTTATTTAYSLGASQSTVIGCSATLSVATAFSVGAFDKCRITECISTNAVTDLSINASATLLVEHSNVFTTIVDSATTPHSWLKDRGKVDRIVVATDATTTPSITATPQLCDIYVVNLTSAGALSTMVINNTSTTGLVDGQRLKVIIARTTGTGTPTFTSGTQFSNMTGTPAPAAGQSMILDLRWRSATSKWMPAAVYGAPGTQMFSQAGTGW